MGESSAPRRPTHDTSTSRREVKRSEYAHTHDNKNTSSKQSKYKYTMKFTGLIASTLMLLVFVMASTAPALSIEKLPTCLLTTRFGDAIRVDGELMHGDIRDNKCCWYGKWEKKSKCEKNPPVTHHDNCYSSIWNTEIRHGEMGARKCCWYGKWEKKSKCEKKSPVTHPDNCYSSIWNTEIRHGEMGAKKCCWYGDWKRKSKCNGGRKDD